MSIATVITTYLKKYAYTWWPTTKSGFLFLFLSQLAGRLTWHTNLLIEWLTNWVTDASDVSNAN